MTLLARPPPLPLGFPTRARRQAASIPVLQLLQVSPTVAAVGVRVGAVSQKLLSRHAKVQASSALKKLKERRTRAASAQKTEDASRGFLLTQERR